MTAVESPAGTVHVRLQGGGEDDTAALRQQLAVCLANGVNDIHVHVDEPDHLGMPALQAMHGVAEYLRRKGGTLTVVGRREDVLVRLVDEQLEDLLPPHGSPSADGPTGQARLGAGPPEAGRAVHRPEAPLSRRPVDPI